MYDLLIYNAKIISLDNLGNIKKGYLIIHKGEIVTVKAGIPPEIESKQKIDVQGKVVMPSLADCHTHLMEYATSEIHQTLGPAQKMAGVANLLTALKSGITALGEHHLGHPVLSQESHIYKEIIQDLPIDINFTMGCCFLGTNPLTLVSSTKPGQIVNKKNLTLDDFKQMAHASDFPGEHIFINATVANLPPSAVPRAGEITYGYKELKEIIDIFHASGKKIGAHIEGNEAALMFIKAGGDVIHHGHGISPEVANLMAENNVALVITPHGGTSSKPTSPEEVFHFYKKGIKIALASDSYLPVHQEATWIDLPEGYLVGPEDFLKISNPIMKYFREKNVSVEEILKLITLNGRDILGLNYRTGSLKAGNKADLIICDKIPGIETTSTENIKYVLKDGNIVINR